jgi:hypothetical protein
VANEYSSPSVDANNSPSGFSFTAKYIDVQYPAIMARILSVSYDKSLLRTRQTMLENKGHVVVSSATIYESIAHCNWQANAGTMLSYSIC